MSIDRSSPTPPYHEYVTKYLLSTGEPTPLGAIFSRATIVRVPSFQRGISWSEETVEKFLESNSILLGTVILGKVGNESAQLIDGLQRFAVGTALLALLYPRVLSPTPSKLSASHHFEVLRTFVAAFEPVFIENHRRLSTFNRNAIKSQYLAIVTDLEGLIDDQLDAGAHELEAFASKCTSLFVDRQIAIDLYHGFSSSSQLINAFIGLNTVRVDLTIVDLLRAALIDQATALGWAASDVEAIENEFTDTFTTDAKPNRNLLPLATLLDADLHSHRLTFPNWSGLAPHHVRRLLEFIGDTLEAARSTENSYLFAIRNCGALPLSICILHYYLVAVLAAEDQDETLANPLLSASSVVRAELHQYYRSCVRRILNGDIGKIGSAGDSLLQGRRDNSLRSVAADVNPPASGPLSDTPAPAWLRGRLRACSKERAKIVFTAYLLPKRDESAGDFAPLMYGQRNNQYQIDHVIPQATKAVDEEDANLDLLVNFCPLIGQDNNTARHQNASVKLGSGGLYATTTRSTHPYMRWLSSSQGHIGAPGLDNVRLLGEERDPPIGDERIDHLVSVLRERL